jgi:hypothetical protein
MVNAGTYKCVELFSGEDIVYWLAINISWINLLLVYLGLGGVLKTGINQGGLFLLAKILI